MTLFEPDDSLFKDRDTLKETYVPNTIVGRDKEIKQYQASLQPVINGEHPDNIFIYGKTGVGKTAVTRYLLNELEESAEQYDVPLSVVYLNCKGLNTSYQTAIGLVNRLKSEEEKMAETGHPESKVYRHLWDELDSLQSTVLIVLDEIDYIDDDTLLYQLTRGNSRETDTRLGIIGISNDTTFREQLSAKVKSSLCEKSISFPSYDAPELQEVLEQRATLAFHEGAVSSGVIELCAAKGAQDGGDARHAIQLLLEAGDIARNTQSDTISEDHVRQAKRHMEQQQIIDIMGSLSDHEQLTLYALAVQTATDETPARSREIYELYVKFCERLSTDPRTLRRVRDYLSDFGTLKITRPREVNLGGDDGIHKAHELNRDLSAVVGAIESTIKRVGAHESIEPYVNTDQ